MDFSPGSRCIWAAAGTHWTPGTTRPASPRPDGPRRDAVDVALTTSFGNTTLTKFTVWTNQLSE